MKTIATELVDVGSKRDNRGRKITTSEEREALLEAYRGSGMTQRAFADREGIKFCTFTSWLQGRRRAGERPVKSPMSFTEVRIGAGSTGASLEVILASGIVIRGRNCAEIAALAQALS